jgi:hypothetical protein
MKRWIRLGGVVPVIGLGLLSRLRPIGWVWYDHHLGESLYAVAAYLGLGFLLPRLPRLGLAALALALCWAVEGVKATGLSGDLERHLPGSRWLLGTTFGWTHFLWYLLGITGVLLLEEAAVRLVRLSKQRP